MNRRRTIFATLALGLAIAPPAVMLAAGGASGAQADGAAAYAKKCNTCHRDSAPAAVRGPALEGVYNRGVASVSGYAYSDGLKAKSGQTWNATNLEGYLANPKTWAPGTKMPVGSPNPAERAAIIEHLKGL